MTCAVANTTTIHSGTSLFCERAAIIARVVPRGKEHLRVLRYSRLVHERRVGRERLYQLDPVPLQKVAGLDRGLSRLLADEPEQSQTTLGAQSRDADVAGHSLSARGRAGRSGGLVRVRGKCPEFGK